MTDGKWAETEAAGQAQASQAALDRGAQPPLVRYDKHAHGYSVA